MTLFEASQNNDIKTVASLLEAGVNPDETNEILKTTPLIAASRNGNLEIVKLLLESGANPNAKEDCGGQNALIEAGYEGSTEIVEALLEEGADPNSTQNGIAALTHMAFKGQTEIARILLNYKAKPNSSLTKEKGRATEPAFVTAASKNNYELVVMLFEAGIKRNKKQLENALLVASKEGYSKIVNYLLHNSEFSSLEKPLKIAILSSNSVDTIKAFFDINVQLDNIDIEELITSPRFKGDVEVKSYLENKI